MASDGTGSWPGHRPKALPSFINNREGMKQLRKFELLINNAVTHSNVTVINEWFWLIITFRVKCVQTSTQYTHLRVPFC